MALNPVEQRLVELQERWQGFVARPDDRLLLWQVPDNARRLLHAFFEVQRHDLPGGVPYVGTDTFIVFDEPFENSIQYARALKAGLAGRYAASGESFEPLGVAPDWPFSPALVPDSAAAWVQALNALAEHHPQLQHLVAVLMPATVMDEPARLAWLQRALQAGPSPRVRLVVLDSLETPALAGLAGSPQVHAQPVPMDAWDVARDTFAQNPGVGAAGVFRTLLAGLFGLVDKGSADQVMAKANDALAFARRHGWLDQEVVVRMLAAGAMLKERRFDEAVVHHRHARSAAEQVAGIGHPAGRQLVLQTWFGEASAHLAAGDLAQAAGCYAQAEPVARDLAHPIPWIEALRMQSHCLARSGEPEAAMACGLRALQVGEQLEPPTRPMTTLPLLANELLQLADARRAGRLQTLRQRLEQELAKLRSETEQRAAALEQSGDAPALQALEEAQGRQAEALVRQAAQVADALAMQAHAEPAPAAGRLGGRTLGAATQGPATPSLGGATQGPIRGLIHGLLHKAHLQPEPGHDRFAAVYARARTLLGPEWPLGAATAAGPDEAADGSPPDFAMSPQAVAAVDGGTPAADAQAAGAQAADVQAATGPQRAAMVSAGVDTP
jgi:hypothetical protein